MLKEWFGTSRFTFNETISLLETGEIKAAWKSIKTGIIKQLPWWAKPVPYQVKSVAIRDACVAVSACKRKYKQTGQINSVRFRTRKQSQSIFIPASAVGQEGVYHTILGRLKLTESIPDQPRDSRLIFDNGRYFLVIPHSVATVQSDNQGRMVAIDPGIRSFISFYSPSSCGKLAEGAFSRIQRLCVHLDRLISKSTKVKSRTRLRMRKAMARIRCKIRDLMDELHHKASLFLVKNFDVILLPTFETSNMARRSSRKIRAKSVRSMLTFSHYRFKQFIKHKALEYGKIVADVNEAYTSKTVSWTGEVIQNLGGRKFIKSRDGQIMDRDLNGARGIFLRALADQPLISENLSCSVIQPLMVTNGSIN